MAMSKYKLHHFVESTWDATMETPTHITGLVHACPVSLLLQKPPMKRKFLASTSTIHVDDAKAIDEC